jgi:hypothetical protein
LHGDSSIDSEFAERVRTGHSALVSEIHKNASKKYHRAWRKIYSDEFIDRCWKDYSAFDEELKKSWRRFGWKDEEFGWREEDLQ